MKVRKVIHFFDKLEDHIRENLSRYPIIYTFVGGFAIVLFWRGVWMTADLIPWLDGPMSIIISSLVLLSTGLFVSFFVTDRIILSGIKQEKKLVEKEEREIRAEVGVLEEVLAKVNQIESEVDTIKSEIDEHHSSEK